MKINEIEKKNKEWGIGVYLTDILIKNGFVYDDSPLYIIQNNCVSLLEKEIKKLIKKGVIK